MDHADIPCAAGRMLKWPTLQAGLAEHRHSHRGSEQTARRSADQQLPEVTWVHPANTPVSGHVTVTLTGLYFQVRRYAGVVCMAYLWVLDIVEFRRQATDISLSAYVSRQRSATACVHATCHPSGRGTPSCSLARALSNVRFLRLLESARTRALCDVVVDFVDVTHVRTAGSLGVGYPRGRRPTAGARESDWAGSDVYSL
jgi:hypothetical protein